MNNADINFVNILTLGLMLIVLLLVALGQPQ